MPATSEKQKRFMGAVKGAKKGQKGVSGAAKKAAKSMTEDQIDDFIEDEELQTEGKNTKAMKDNKKITMKGQSKAKKRGERLPPNKVEEPGKGGKYTRKEKHKGTMEENADIDAFITCLLTKNYASANKYLNNAVESKLLKRIEEELDKPLFHTYE